jgi:hypothetical protein
MISRVQRFQPATVRMSNMRSPSQSPRRSASAWLLERIDCRHPTGETMRLPSHEARLRALERRDTAEPDFQRSPTTWKLMREARRSSPGQATIRPAKISECSQVSLIRAQHRTTGPTASCTSLIRRLRTLTPPNNRSRYSLPKNGAGVKLVSRSEPTSAGIARWF